MPDLQVNDTDLADEQEDELKENDSANKPDPTRFGDWEKNGRCVDF